MLFAFHISYTEPMQIYHCVQYFFHDKIKSNVVELAKQHNNYVMSYSYNLYIYYGWREDRKKNIIELILHHKRWTSKTIQGGPERMQQLWSLMSRTSSIKRICFLFYWVENSFSNKMTPWPLILGEAFGY